MIIESIKLSQYRNYKTLDLSLHSGINIFYGDNAQGKTNVLEAIYLAGTNKSHRTSRDRDLIAFDAQEAHIKMLIRKKEREERIDMHLKTGKKKGIAINGIPIAKTSQLMGVVNLVFFSPEDLQIIKNGPAERRKFIDIELCQLDKIYLYNLVNYNKALAQRNALLKISYHSSQEYYEQKGSYIGQFSQKGKKELDSQNTTLPGSFGENTDEMLALWEMQIANYGKQVILLREGFVEKLNTLVKEIHFNLSGGKEELTICYEPDSSADLLLEKLQKGREQDKKIKTTMTGPHRDDIRFQINGVDIRKFGSQGQQRTAALALKMAEIELVKQTIDDTPILLLDDVLSELDSNRQHQLLNRIEGVQTMLTCTGLDEFVGKRITMDRIFRVENGTVVRESY